MTTRLGQILAEARERKDLSINQVAQRAELGSSYLSQLEKGVIKTPGPDRLKRLAHVLDLDPVELLEVSGRLTVEQQLLMDRRPSFSEFVASDPRLTREGARALVALYLHFTGGRE